MSSFVTFSQRARRFLAGGVEILHLLNSFLTGESMFKGELHDDEEEECAVFEEDDERDAGVRFTFFIQIVIYY